VSRLATVVGALSAIVTLVDYLVARSFLSHWLQRQIGRDDNGWRISPTLNLVFIVGLVGLVWLATESSVADAEARKRLFRLRTHLVLGGLAAWFFFGPSIGNIDLPAVSPPGIVPETAGAAPPVGQLTSIGVNHLQSSQSHPSHGHTSQFTWNRPVGKPPAAAWKPGDGLRAVAHLLEDATGQSRPVGR
jgi:hypothetical protein